MSRTTVWNCDGCDEQVIVGHNEALPRDWTGNLEVSIKGFRSYDGSTRNFDLCGKCQRKLLELSNPKQWPRKEKES